MVKPVDGEQGKGISVNISSEEEMDVAIERAHQHGDRVLLEQFCEGQDLRIVVINHRVVAAAVPPGAGGGDGHSSIALLIETEPSPCGCHGGMSRASPWMPKPGVAWWARGIRWRMFFR